MKELRISALPKGKRRWLARVVKTMLRENEWRPEMLTVAIGVAFASNRRGDVAEDALLAWLHSHEGELPRLGRELARDMLPPEALAHIEAADAGLGSPLSHVQAAAGILSQRLGITGAHP